MTPSLSALRRQASALQAGSCPPDPQRLYRFVADLSALFDRATLDELAALALPDDEHALNTLRHQLALGQLGTDVPAALQAAARQQILHQLLPLNRGQLGAKDGQGARPLGAGWRHDDTGCTPVGTSAHLTP